jgi:hypothetical protein
MNLGAFETGSFRRVIPVQPGYRRIVAWNDSTAAPGAPTGFNHADRA